MAILEKLKGAASGIVGGVKAEMGRRSDDNRLYIEKYRESYQKARASEEAKKAKVDARRDVFGEKRERAPARSSSFSQPQFDFMTGGLGGFGDMPSPKQYVTRVVKTSKKGNKKRRKVVKRVVREAGRSYGDFDRQLGNSLFGGNGKGFF